MILISFRRLGRIHVDALLDQAINELTVPNHLPLTISSRARIVRNDDIITHRPVLGHRKRGFQNVQDVQPQIRSAMTTKQINDILLQIANYDGQIKVHEDRIEQITADVEYITLQDFEKDKLDTSDLEKINSLRFDYMTTAYRLNSCRKKIVSLKKAANIDLD